MKIRARIKGGQRAKPGSEAISEPALSADVCKAACTRAEPPKAPVKTTLSHSQLRRESMNVEYTGRQFEITPITRKQVEGGLEKIQKILAAILKRT